MKKSFSSCLCLVLALSLPVHAQTILLSELGEFRCGLRTMNATENVIIKSSTLEYWKIGPSSTFIGGGGMVDREKRIYEFSYIEKLSKFEQLGNSGLIVVPLQPADTNQFQKHVVSFWECDEDSLHLVSIAPTGRVASPGRFRLSETREIPNGNTVVYSISENVDGQVWGAVDVFLFNKIRRESALVHTANFGWEQCARKDTLSVAWASDTGSKLQLIRRVDEVERDGPTIEDCRSVTVSTDTIYVNVEELEFAK